MTLVWHGLNVESIEHFNEALWLSPNDPAGWTNESVKVDGIGW